VVGKGINTAFIDARSSIYYYLPAYGSYSSAGGITQYLNWDVNAGAGDSPLNINLNNTTEMMTSQIMDCTCFHAWQIYPTLTLVLE
jgi:hypothetical protein